MDNIKNLISQRNLNEPPEIKLIKDYVQTNFKSSVDIAIRNDQIIINAPGAALAGALRLKIMDIQEVSLSDKRISIHISRGRN
jgi:hypothetical protein